MNRQGFSLIETTIYCCISGLIGVLMCQFYTTSLSNFRHTQQAGQQLMALYTCHDVMVRDLEAASCFIGDWHTQDQLVCKINEESVGWECKKGKLYRIMGSYDFNRKEWQKKTQALIAQNVTAFDYQLQSKDQIAFAASIMLAIGNSEPLATTIHLFNRIIV